MALTRTSRLAWLLSAVSALAAALVLAFLLSVATNSPTLYEQHYVWLFWLNVALAGILVLVIVATAVRLLLRVSRGRFGSRLLLKLTAIFALVGVVPGVLIYTVSYQFVSRSIESWFDARVEGALDAGVALGRNTVDSLVADLAGRTRGAADRLAETGGSVLDPIGLERLREQLAATEVAVVGANGQILMATTRLGPQRSAAAAPATSAPLSASAPGTGVLGDLLPERPPLSLLRQARAQRVASQAEGLDEEAVAAGGVPRVRAVALLPSSAFVLGEQERYLAVTRAIPTALAANALAVTSAYREYQQRALARSGLRNMYIGTLTLALVLAVFGALLLAVALGNQLAEPLLLLAAGVSEVARGDFSPKAVFASRDELGGLTRSFAEMTQQLSDARELVHKSVTQVEGARTNLQTILDNLTAGVIVFDRSGSIDTVNPGATRILKLPISAYRGRRLEEVNGLQSFGLAVRQRFESHASSPEAGERDHWQDAFELQATERDARRSVGPPGPAGPGRPGGSAGDSTTLLVRGAAMPQGARLLVFDDITELVSAQRIEAWSEVARRLAHEIKNPLTPIQLSAERLQMKLESKLASADQAMLVRSVSTIVNQVQAMKTLVDAFRDYARMPAATMRGVDLNALVGEVLGLYAGAQESGMLVARLAPALPPILGDPTQLRQVIHNLVQNGLDAVEGQGDGRVEVCTEAVRHEGDAGLRAVRLVVVDNGPGFPETVLKRAFEPYVTTKAKGTGLGLAVVKKIADEHGARLRVGNAASAEGLGATGARVSLSFSRLAPAVGPGEAAAS